MFIKDKISVIMPVYNVNGEWLREAIDSILNQTYTNYEFIIIDDGSTNDTPEILTEYAQKDSRIKIINGEHKGISNALNKGLEVAQGEFIARMDGDDISLPERFEKQINYLKQNPDIGIVGCNIVLFPKEKFMTYQENIGVLDVLRYCPVAHPTVMMRNEMLARYQLKYNEEYKTAEDYELWSRAVKYIKISNINEILYKYRINPNGNSRNAALNSNGERLKQILMNHLTSDKKVQNKIWDILEKETYLELNFSKKLFDISNVWHRGKKIKVLRFLGLTFYIGKVRS